MPDPGGRQLDRKRQSVQAAADLGHDRPVVWSQREVRSNHPGPLQEELDRTGFLAVCGEIAGSPGFVRLDLGCGKRQGWNGMLVLLGQAQRTARGGQDRSPGCGGEEIGHHVGGLGQLFEVVQD
ncbi:MAG: hypothetical protein H0U22_02540 [Geodermatophilaceae bacterium]|nr:hypothetical protein [Geodermatophilaceae bacterium]